MRVPSGVPGFDAMVQGGIPSGSTIVAQGPSGTEKLAFGLQFLAYGLKNGEAAVAILSTMSPSIFLEELGRLGVDVATVQAENRIRIVDWYAQREEAVSDVEERGPSPAAGRRPPSPMSIALDTRPPSILKAHSERSEGPTRYSTGRGLR